MHSETGVVPGESLVRAEKIVDRNHCGVIMDCIHAKPPVGKTFPYYTALFTLFKFLNFPGVSTGGEV